MIRRSAVRVARWLLPVVLLLGNAGVALAYFSTTGAGSAQTTVPTINGPSAVSATQSGTGIAVTWAAATVSSGPAVTGYRVSRSDGATVCGSPTLVTTLSCTDAAVPAGSYTYTVTAVYHTWTGTGVSPSVTVLSAPTINSKPSNPAASAAATFTFSGGGGTGYQCQLDGAAFASCTSPTMKSGLSDGPHTFAVRAATGGSSGPAATYTWTVDTTPPTQTIALAAGASGAYLSGTTLYYKGNASGSFGLQDTVNDAGSGAASAAFPAIGAAGWTHAAQTVTTPTGGPYTSSTFSWSANPAAPAAYAVTGADAAGNTVATTLTFTSDIAAPVSGAVNVNGTAASPGGSATTVTNSTSFAIGSRTDYTDAGSGLSASVLTVQSESLSLNTCGAPGSGGPFTTATTITGTTQPAGIQAGYCYVYTLTGTDHVGNLASIKTTVEDDAKSFTVTTQPSSVTAGTATANNAVVLTAIKNGATDTGYAGAALSWSGASASPNGTSPTLPANPAWVSGTATFGITLVKAENETLSVTDGTRSATFAPITVAAGGASLGAWTGVSTTSSAGIPNPCLFTCTYSSGFGNGKTWTAYVSVTDSLGNIVSNLGFTQTVMMTLNPGARGSVTPTTLTIPSAGPATSTATVRYSSPAAGTFTDTLTASGGGQSVTATFH